MFSAIASLFELVKSLPAILSALLALKQIWEQFLDVNERRDAMLKFTEALNHARDTRDPSKVADVLNSITGGPGGGVQPPAA